jgi:DNA ligase-1
MTDLADGESTEMKGSGAKPYRLRNMGGVYSCTCPAWMNQSHPIERRTCKHLKKLRGDAAEAARVGAAPPVAQTAACADDEGEREGAAKGPPLLLAHVWQNDIDLAGWWMSEKLDGVRAYWDGKQFLSRLGNVYHAPDWFLEGLPDVPLDGELWCGRKLFQRCVSIARRQDRSDLWKELTYLVFDAPDHDAPFEERLAQVEKHVRDGAPRFARNHAHVRCESVEHLRAELARVEALGGEGLMLRQPGSRYEVGRSTTLLKVKSFKDAEARVVEHAAGAGRHKGRVGALVVELENGTRFSVGTGLSDEERRSPPPVGAIISFRYQELSDGGVPRFPSFIGVRDDVRWKGEATATAQPPRAPAPPAPPMVARAWDGAIRRFELVEGTSSKFWEIELRDAEHTVRFGRIGTAGQARTKAFPDATAAAADAARLVEEKTAKGYAEASSG